MSLRSTKLGIKRNYYILETKDILNRILKKWFLIKVHFTWVSSHIGIYGNEEVDSIPKSATLGPSSESMNIPFTDYFEQYKKLLGKNQILS